MIEVAGFLRMLQPTVNCANNPGTIATVASLGVVTDQDGLTRRNEVAHLVASLQIVARLDLALLSPLPQASGSGLAALSVGHRATSVALSSSTPKISIIEPSTGQSSSAIRIMSS